MIDFKAAAIVRSSNTVTVDGVMQWVDCSSLPAYVRVVHWYTDRGHIEFVNDPRGVFLPNLNITDFAPYQHLIEAWEKAKDEAAARDAANATARAEGADALDALRPPG